jgi:hypothetical protein
MYLDDLYIMLLYARIYVPLWVMSVLATDN